MGSGGSVILQINRRADDMKNIGLQKNLYVLGMIVVAAIVSLRVLGFVVPKIMQYILLIILLPYLYLKFTNR